jgi:hypothetical protein
MIEELIIPSAKNQVSNHSGTFKASLPINNKTQSTMFIINHTEGIKPIKIKKSDVFLVDVVKLRK